MDVSEPPPEAAERERGQLGLARAGARERAFNAPWPVLLMIGLLLAGYGVQLVIGSEAVIARFGLVPIAVSAGEWLRLLTHMFLHLGWIHLILNATALLAFGPPIARLYGSGMGGALRFLAFYLLCGLIGGLTFWALSPTGGVQGVGASGAVSGLMGGAARLIGGREHPSAIFSRSALSFVVPWIVLNLLIAVAGVAIAIPIGWEAHLGGLIAGLLLIGLFAPRRRLG